MAQSDSGDSLPLAGRAICTVLLVAQHWHVTWAMLHHSASAHFCSLGVFPFRSASAASGCPLEREKPVLQCCCLEVPVSVRGYHWSQVQPWPVPPMPQTHSRVRFCPYSCSSVVSVLRPLFAFSLLHLFPSITLEYICLLFILCTLQWAHAFYSFVCKLNKINLTNWTIWFVSNTFLPYFSDTDEHPVCVCFLFEEMSHWKCWTLSVSIDSACVVWSDHFQFGSTSPVTTDSMTLYKTM